MRVITKKAAVDIIRLKAGLQREEIMQAQCICDCDILDVSIRTEFGTVRGIVDGSNAKILFCRQFARG